ncbi:type I glyceraldehyde-3-phosphate dehydrogenase [Candidatus Gottesmanbacteria bacterium RIFCSPHIGHO2_02_FULL_39_14]|uniref:Glyceraldehyde-3-phosphate dehydrogenase n=2 Tax=Candidatus Gottesmaniibacteriota TaxID=1752720 RepID=A0A1F5ZYU0_9BACT|nr:MAG: type I glyceraldehyde-3-phosphate dehydrogenase [Candidatus Gottesmanbacteria bacterium RIFCSPHIGHO2_02_FULL_39_14]OGG32439.1 MAG: type I glyceraldehyde-3-phosphate dehydrogenase [Candidatus Gottesmanbacteria bacterium RIFCSPLOWO2_02_FULL_38_8]
MENLKIGINGFGRIGRLAARIILKRKNLDLVAVNSRADSSSHAYLLQYDSTYGQLDLPVKSNSQYIYVGLKKIAVLKFEQPALIPWQNHQVDIVIDASGKFRTAIDLKGHLSGSQFVILSAPAKDKTKTFVLGVNHHLFNPRKDKIISNSSCTTNCLSTTLKVLHDNFGVTKAFMTTVHAVTDSQNLLDNSHKQIRLRRSVLPSIIPASTGSAKDIIKLFPHLNGKIFCQAIRVPVATVSLINLVAEVKIKVNKDEVNNAFKTASKKNLAGILSVTSDELVSIDFKGSPYSSIVDLNLTEVADDKLLNVYAWYDNEWGYTERLVDLCQYIGKKSKII